MLELTIVSALRNGLCATITRHARDASFMTLAIRNCPRIRRAIQSTDVGYEGMAGVMAGIPS
jgi:hypothetical protein